MLQGPEHLVSSAIMCISVDIFRGERIYIRSKVSIKAKTDLNESTV